MQEIIVFKRFRLSFGKIAIKGKEFRAKVRLWLRIALKLALKLNLMF